MDNFAKYEEMRDNGASPADVYASAESAGLDNISCIRLIRKVFGLSLAQAKEVAGGAKLLSVPQEVKEGSTVYWEGWTTEEGFYIMQARVSRIEGEYAILEDHKKFRVTHAALEEAPVDGPGFASLEVAFLARPLTDRLGKFLRFVEELAGKNGQANTESKRHVV